MSVQQSPPKRPPLGDRSSLSSKSARDGSKGVGLPNVNGERSGKQQAKLDELLIRSSVSSRPPPTDSVEVNMAGDDVAHAINIHDLAYNDDFLALTTELSLNLFRINERDATDGGTVLHRACEGGNKRIVEWLLHKKARVSSRNFKGQEPLHLACECGRQEIVELLISKTDLNSRDNSAVTPLMLACARGYREISLQLIDKGANVFKRDAKGCTPLYRACESGHEIICTFLVLKGPATLKIGNNDGATPLHISCREGHFNVQLSLLDKGSEVDCRDGAGRSALMYASAAGHKAIVASLVSRGAAVNATDRRGWAALHYACEGGRKDISKLLISAGAYINARNGDGDTPMEVSPKAYVMAPELKTFYFRKLASDGLLDLVIEEIVEDSGRMHEQDKDDGSSSLMLACLHGHDTLATLLISRGADVMARDNDGSTALHYAARGGHSECIVHLVSGGAAVDVRNNEEVCALSVASAFGHYDAVLALVESGADVLVCDARRQSALHRASDAGHRSTAEALLRSGADIDGVDCAGRTPLHLACLSQRDDVAMLLVEAFAELNSVDEDGDTALHAACQSGSARSAQLLIDRGARYLQNRSGYSPLHYAALRNHLPVVKLLCAVEVDVNMPDAAGDTPLHIATLHGHSRLSLYLVSRRACIMARNFVKKTPVEMERGGRTPLQVQLRLKALHDRISVIKPNLHKLAQEGDGRLPEVRAELAEYPSRVDERDATFGSSPLAYAAQSGALKLVSFLLDRGAVAGLASKNGNSPLMFACMAGHRAVAEALLMRGADLHQRNEDGYTPLFFAAIAPKRGVEVASLLIERGAEVDARAAIATRKTDIYSRSKDGWTPLHWACERADRAMAELLIRSGADIHIKNTDNFSPLELNEWTRAASGELQALFWHVRGEVSDLHRLASEDRVAELAQELGRLGAAAAVVRVNEKMFGWTPLLWACQWRRREAALLLVQRGADVHARGNSGQTSLELLRSRGDDSLAEELQVLHTRLQAERARAQRAEDARRAREQEVAASKEDIGDMREMLIAAGLSEEAAAAGAVALVLDHGMRHERLFRKVFLRSGAAAFGWLGQEEALLVGAYLQALPASPPGSPSRASRPSTSAFSL